MGGKMAVRIESIKVNHLGPLSEFQMDLGDVNLVYARNEQGKTHLVEFLVYSLFKKGSVDPLRKLENCRGEVRVAGIAEKPLGFTIQGRGKKLEDLLIEKSVSLPPRIGRMLVVRAGELGFTRDNNGGADQAVVKEFLSNERFLDEIDNRIKKNTQTATIDANGNITGAEKGELSDRQAKQKQLRAMDDLLAQVDNLYSDGNVTLLRARHKDAQAALDHLDRARRHLAWKCSRQMEAMRREQNQTPREKVEELKQNIWQYRQIEKHIQEKDRAQQEKQACCEHYGWLVEAIHRYKEIGGKELARPKPTVLYLFGAFLVASVIASFLRAPLLTLVFTAVAVALGWRYLRCTLALLGHAVDLKERDEIAAEFTRRFDLPFSGLAVLEEQRKKLEPENSAADYLAKELENSRREFGQLGDGIRQAFSELSIEAAEPAQWEAAVSESLEHLRKLEDDLRQFERQYDALDVPADAQLAEDPGIGYSKTEYEQYRDQVAGLDSEINQAMRDKENLKQSVASKVDKQMSEPWELLIEELKKKRAALSREIRDLTAQIVAGILVHQCIQVLRQEEERNILAGLQSDLVKQPLKRLTGRYELLSLDGKDLVVNDGLGNFPLSDLSTGAQEQILLAMRMGFAQKLMGQNALFLILDDAFQHSDWERRPRLVDEVASLAAQGWQILYFTMDDHIRDLFETRVKPQFGDQYRYRELTPHGAA
jgi:hypothetical protein